MSGSGKDLCVDCKDYDRCGENNRPCEQEPIPLCASGKHWFITKKHRCGPATEVCQDCGHERAV